MGWDGDADLGDGSGSGSGSNGSSLDARRAILARSVKGQYSTEGPEWARVSDGARDLVRRMLCVDDAARISTGEALAHPWLAEAASAAAAASGRTAVAGGPGRQQQRPPVVGGRGRGGGEAEAEWVHTPSGEAPGAIRSLIGAVWCRGSSFVARFSSPRGAGAKVSHSASGTETTSSISSAVTS